jgi:hypothetical protein
MKLTRRAMAAMLPLVGAEAQTPRPGPANPPAPTPETELQAAREQLSARVLALSQVEVPMSTEPAFEFKA